MILVNLSAAETSYQQKTRGERPPDRNSGWKSMIFASCRHSERNERAGFADQANCWLSALRMRL
jgi:hypothetical protein